MSRPETNFFANLLERLLPVVLLNFLQKPQTVDQNNQFLLAEPRYTSQTPEMERQEKSQLLNFVFAEVGRQLIIKLDVQPISSINERDYTLDKQKLTTSFVFNGKNCLLHLAAPLVFSGGEHFDINFVLTGVNRVPIMDSFAVYLYADKDEKKSRETLAHEVLAHCLKLL